MNCGYGISCNVSRMKGKIVLVFFSLKYSEKMRSTFTENVEKNESKNTHHGSWTTNKYYYLARLSFMLLFFWSFFRCVFISLKYKPIEMTKSWIFNSHRRSRQKKHTKQQQHQKSWNKIFNNNIIKKSISTRPLSTFRLLKLIFGCLFKFRFWFFDGSLLVHQ